MQSRLIATPPANYLSLFLSHLKNNLDTLASNLEIFFDSSVAAKNWCKTVLFQTHNWDLFLGEDTQFCYMDGEPEWYSPTKKLDVNQNLEETLAKKLNARPCYTTVYFTPTNPEEMGIAINYWHRDSGVDPLETSPMDDPTYTITFYELDEHGNQTGGTWYLDTPVPLRIYPDNCDQEAFRKALLRTIQDLQARFLADVPRGVLSPYIKVTEPGVLYRGLVDKCFHISPQNTVPRTHIITKAMQPATGPPK